MDKFFLQSLLISHHWRILVLSIFIVLQLMITVIVLLLSMIVLFSFAIQSLLLFEIATITIIVIFNLILRTISSRILWVVRFYLRLNRSLRSSIFIFRKVLLLNWPKIICSSIQEFLIMKLRLLLYSFISICKLHSLHLNIFINWIWSFEISSF